MAVTIAERAEASLKPSTADRVVDAVRHAAHASHEAQLLKSVARDAIEDGIHAARRGIRRGVREFEDVKDQAILGVRRRPLQTVAGMFGIGLALGVAVGWMIGRRR